MWRALWATDPPWDTGKHSAACFPTDLRDQHSASLLNCAELKNRHQFCRLVQKEINASVLFLNYELDPQVIFMIRWRGRMVTLPLEQVCCVRACSAVLPTSQRITEWLWNYDFNGTKQAPSLALQICLTLGRMFSSSPFCSLHSTLQVVSPAMPKLSACRGENNSLHIWGKTGAFISGLNMRITNTNQECTPFAYICLSILTFHLEMH